MAYTYRSESDLHALGIQIRDAAIHLTLTQDAAFAAAQERANNDANRAAAGTPTQVPGYQPPTSGRPDDKTNLRAYLQQEYGTIPDLFTGYAMPDPDDCLPMARALYGTATAIQPSLRLTERDGGFATTQLTRPVVDATEVSTMLGYIEVHMKPWQGDAADAFSGNLTAIDRAAQYQTQLATALGMTLEAQLEVRRRLLTDIWEIGQKTLKVLRSLDGWCATDSSAKAVLTISGAVAAVAFLIVTDGTGAAVGIEVLQAAGTILGAAPDKKTETGIHGRTVPAVLTSMVDAITTLDRLAGDQEHELIRALKALDNVTQDLLHKGRLRARLPDEFRNAGTADVTTLDRGKQFYDR
ncbi:hypothetical protein [Cryptosporangium sp. NPDC051539]|uniref:hypothetical protein n=1 Tax=Cryptosporangium sp. NPDC051539 TaxID=3363962 RepID=UPI0037B302BC